MQFFMQMEASKTSCVMERVLGVVRFRGFHLMEVNAHTPPGADSLRITLKVTGERGGDNLRRQLEKLQDVDWVELFTLADPMPIHGGLHLPLPAQPAVGVAV